MRQAREANMKEKLTYTRLFLFVVAACLLTVGVAQATESWVGQIQKTLDFYATKYPDSNFAPYDRRLILAEKALMVGDQQTVKGEMEMFFRMLHTRAHGVNGVAADELFNFALMVTPLQEYGISTPASPPGTK